MNYAEATKKAKSCLGAFTRPDDWMCDRNEAEAQIAGLLLKSAEANKRAERFREISLHFEREAKEWKRRAKKAEGKTNEC